jgi:hypothetical protein
MWTRIIVFTTAFLGIVYANAPAVAAVIGHVT